MPESTVSGALTEAVFYILLSLYEPMHGYAIIKNIERLSGGRLSLGAGTLYGALNTLAEKRLIQSVGEGMLERKKAYRITEAGRAAVENELLRLSELLRNGMAVTGRAAT